MIRIIITAFTILTASISIAQTKKPLPASKPAVASQASIVTSKDSASYAFGLSVAENLKSLGITGLNYTVLSKAMNDVFEGNKLLIASEQSQKVIYNYITEANKAKFAGSIAEGNKFLEDNKKKTGIVTTPSGLQYQILQPGSGAKPNATDEVTVHYKGTLLNGKQFDSSYDRKEPTALTLNNVIPGWTEGVQLMPMGAKYRFFVPYQLGYGEKGAGNDIPPYSVLIFEIELIKIGK